MGTTFRDHTVVRGDTWQLIATYVENGEPKNLTGYSFRAYIRKHRNDPGPAAQFTPTVDVAAGIATFTIDPPQSQAFEGKYHYDVEETNPTGAVTTIFWGAWNVLPDATWL